MVRSIAFLLLSATLAQAPSDGLQLQRQAIARIDGYINTFRRTGDFSKQSELDQADRELAASYKALTAAGDFASAAYTRIKQGDTQRYRQNWENAVAFYRDAERDAIRARHNAYQAKAVTSRALAQLLGKQLDAAAPSAEDAVRLAEGAEPKTYLVNALVVRGEVESARGDQQSAIRTVDRAIELGKQVGDRELLMYAHSDRADYLVKQSSRCDYEQVRDICLRDLDGAKAEWGEAIGLARGFGFDGLARMFGSFVTEIDTRRILVQQNSGFLARLATGLKVTLDAREANVDVAVSLTISTKNGRDEPVAPTQPIVITLESDSLPSPVRVTLPAGQTSIRTQVAFNRAGVALLRASAPNLEAGQAAIAIKRPAREPQARVRGVSTRLALSTDPISRVGLEILPARVTPKNGVWSASLFVTALDDRNEPVDAADDLPVRLAASIGTVTPQTIVIRKGSSTAAEDLHVTSTTAGTDQIYAFAPRLGRRFETSIEYERPRPARLLVQAAPARVANSGRTPVEIMVILQDDHHNPATFGDQPLPIVLTSTLGTLNKHDAIVLKGTTAAGPFTLTSARAGAARITARAEGLPDDSADVSFEFPWLLVLIAAVGGATGATLRSPQLTQQKHLSRNLAVGVAMGVLVFTLAQLGVPGLIPSIPLPSIENLTLNELGAFLLGLFGGYLGRQVLDKLLAPKRPDRPRQAPAPS